VSFSLDNHSSHFYFSFSSFFISDSAEGRQYFNDPIDGFINLYILLTSANFPDVMYVLCLFASISIISSFCAFVFRMPAFDEAWYNSLIFISFLVIGLIFLLNFVLAIIYASYRKNVKVQTSFRSDFCVFSERFVGFFQKEVSKILELQHQLLAKAFDLLAPNGRMNLATWQQLFRVLRPNYP
jgi:hypothetical protein